MILIIFAAFITFFSFWLVLSHVSQQTMRRIVGYKGYVDVLVHGTILVMFLGTSTLGLIQAEAAGIAFSLYLRSYAWALGYERRNAKGKWVRTTGKWHAMRAAKS